MTPARAAQHTGYMLYPGLFWKKKNSANILRSLLASNSAQVKNPLPSTEALKLTLEIAQDQAGPEGNLTKSHTKQPED